jgi:hypothetical protein
MEEVHIANVCKVTTTKIKDFDETILVVQVWFGKFGIKDVLLDGGSHVNIITYSLSKRFGLRKPQPTRFVVRIIDQWKVQLVGLMSWLLSCLLIGHIAC